MRDRETIGQELQTQLLSIWRRERLVSPAAYELAQGLVEQNIEFLRRQLTREEQLQFGRSGSKNELRRKGLCFICKEPWGPDHSCVRDADEVAEVEQVGIPSVCQGEGSSSDESMGSVEDASGEREQPCRDDDDSRSELCSNVQGEQSRDSMGDTLGDESLVTIQPEQHLMEPESAKEDTMHIMPDSPLGESQMEAHIESMMDTRLTLGSTIEEE